MYKRQLFGQTRNVTFPTGSVSRPLGGSDPQGIPVPPRLQSQSSALQSPYQTGYGATPPQNPPISQAVQTSSSTLQTWRDGARRVMQRLRREPEPDPPAAGSQTPPSNGDQTQARASSGIEGLTEETPAPKAAQPTATVRVRARAKPKPRSEPSQAASSSQEPSAPSAPSAEPVPSAQPTEIQVVQPAASTALAEVTGAQASVPREADTTEDTGRINAWFRMQNPTFYNTKTYDPLADLNACLLYTSPSPRD